VAELGDNLAACVEGYTAAFPAESVSVKREDFHLSIEAGGKRVEVLGDSQLPGFQIQRDGSNLAVQVGLLPGDRLFYLDVAAGQYLSIEELTRRVLDRVLFPKLKEE